MTIMIKPEQFDYNALVSKSNGVAIEFQSKMIDRLKESFTTDDQQWFLANLYVYVNYHPINDFPVSLETVYKLIGFATKANAKRTLLNNFTQDEDYKISLSPKDEGVRGGQNEELIMLNVSTFKDLCMMAKTKKGKQIRKYYVKLEHILFKIVSDERLEFEKQLVEKSLQLEVQQDRLVAAEAKNLDLKSKIVNKEIFKQDGYIYIITTKQYSLNNVFRLGRTANLDQRMRSYELGRVQSDRYYYVYIYHTANVELLEYILRKLLVKYKENESTDKDIFIIPLHILRPLVDSICINFNKYIIPKINNMITDNLEWADSELSNELGPLIEPYAFLDDDEIFTPPTFYYDQIVEQCKNYPDVTIITPKENIKTVFDRVTIQCPHTTTVQDVQSLLVSHCCNKCVNQKQHDKLFLRIGTPRMIDPPSVDTPNIEPIIQLIDETSPKFRALGVIEKNRKITQNIIITKLATEQINLLTEYANCDTYIKYACSYGHNCQITYAYLKKMNKDFCRGCSDIVDAAVKNKADNIKLTEDAAKIGWTHIKTNNGNIEWKCPQGHSVCKTLRELKKGVCAKCKIIKNTK